MSSELNSLVLVLFLFLEGVGRWRGGGWESQCKISAFFIMLFSRNVLPTSVQKPKCSIKSDTVGVCTSVLSQENLMTSLFVGFVHLQSFIFAMYLWFGAFSLLWQKTKFTTSVNWQCGSYFVTYLKVWNDFWQRKIMLKYSSQSSIKLHVWRLTSIWCCPKQCHALLLCRLPKTKHVIFFTGQDAPT